jgi:hypothetical protein
MRASDVARGEENIDYTPRSALMGARHAVAVFHA